MDDGNAWLARLRHDLVKRFAWPARDRRDLGGAVEPGELVPRLIDEEGNATSTEILWRALVAEAPPSLARIALDDFAEALRAADRAAAANQLEPVLALEGAVDRLARTVKGER